MNKIYLRAYHPLSIYSDDLVFKLNSKGFVIGEEIVDKAIYYAISELFAIGWNVMLLHAKEETTLYIDQWNFKKR